MQLNLLKGHLTPFSNASSSLLTLSSLVTQMEETFQLLRPQTNLQTMMG